MAKILFLLEDYNYFYTHESKKAFSSNKNITYLETLNSLLAKKYYQSDGLANGFKELGHETQIIIPEANPLQKKWLKENNKSLLLKWQLQKPLRSYKSRILKQHRTSFNSIQFEVLLEQVKKLKPEIIYFYSNIYITQNQISELKKHSKKIVLQWATPIWREHPEFPYQSFDLIVTAALQLKEYFDNKKFKTAYIQQAFDTSILNHLPKQLNQTKGEVIFIGGFSLGHNYRFEVLEHLLKNKVKLEIYGFGKETLPPNSLVAQNMKEALFGIDMYQKYTEFKIALHIHTTGKENDDLDWNKYAGAKRLFEITGVGTLLITTHQQNVKDLFETDKEVVTFTTPNDLLQKINYLLKNPQKIEEIADAGQKRTIKEHSFQVRAKELSQILFN